MYIELSGIESSGHWTHTISLLEKVIVAIDTNECERKSECKRIENKIFA